uniref:Translation initiation factor IF2/IF5 domain-containing protein n=1 Tax=viral metagenome TaxID=1070528 RepID=A0A6C0J8U9_9ZZZZ
MSTLEMTNTLLNNDCLCGNIIFTDESEDTGDKIVIPCPKISTVGYNRISLTNFVDICKILERDSSHILNYISSELAVYCYEDFNKNLIIKGYFNQKNIENVLRDYIKSYVMCHMCYSGRTILGIRKKKLSVNCSDCNSQRSV